jgi:microcin C transport system substrate-binding protein
MISRRVLLGAGLSACATRLRAQTPTPPAGVTRSHAIATLGEPALPPDFPHFPYVNPTAPKGGEVALSALGGFDSFNPFIVRGNAAGGVSRIWETLLVNSADEPDTAYGHLARVIELPADRMWVAFELVPDAHFHDGTPITADDIAWTFDTLRAQGRPYYRQYYADVDSAVVERPDRIVFRFKHNQNRELPQIVGQVPALPKHWWNGRDFSKPLTDIPLGSAAYKVDSVELGRTIAYARVPDWWARERPTGRGLYNFDRMRTEYFRDATVALEAFKAGQIDYRDENIAKQWATAYDFPAARSGLVKKELVRHRLPTGMQGFAMNTRRPLFKDRRVRKAFAWAFDFEWANKNLFYGAYTRTRSYFSNSDLESSGLPTPEEVALLAPYRDRLPPEIFAEPFTLPVTDGSGSNREELRQALTWLRDAGWEIRDRKLVDPTGAPASVEFLLPSSDYERVVLPYAQTLQKLGIELRARTVDPAQYQRRMDTFDYDMTILTVPESESPGNEQVGFWTSAAATQEGSDNAMGVSDPVVDALVQKVIGAKDRAELLTATHALDRVLLAGWYVVPNWHLQSLRLAYWDRFGRPEVVVRSGIVFADWWIDAKRAAATDAARTGKG